MRAEGSDRLYKGVVMVLNEVARSMGEADFYPFVMPRPVVAKLQFVHLVVFDAHGRPAMGRRTEAAMADASALQLAHACGKGVVTLYRITPKANERHSWSGL